MRGAGGSVTQRGGRPRDSVPGGAPIAVPEPPRLCPSPVRGCPPPPEVGAGAGGTPAPLGLPCSPAPRGCSARAQGTRLGSARPRQLALLRAEPPRALAPRSRAPRLTLGVRAAASPHGGAGEINSWGSLRGKFRKSCPCSLREALFFRGRQQSVCRRPTVTGRG